VPGLGWLFRARNTERVRTNLLVFIRPTILRDSVQAAFETNAKYRFIRDLQLQQAERPIPLLRGENRPLLPEPQPIPQPAPPPSESEAPQDQEAPNDGG